MQKYLWQIGGEILALSSGGELLIVVHREFPTVVNSYTNSIGATEYTILDLESFEVLQNGKVPLSATGGTINWVGFTADDIPAVYTSDGILSLLDRSRRPRQARWVPVLDTTTLARRAGKHESYWPIGVGSKYAHVIILKVRSV